MRTTALLLMSCLSACALRRVSDSDHRIVVDLSCGFNFDRYLAVGDAVRLHAARTDFNSDVLTCLDSLVPGQHWHSSSSNIVTVAADGLARALSPGSVEVYTQTKYGPAQGRIVSLPTLAHFGFDSDSVVVRIGVYTQLTVDPRDSAGNHLYPLVLFGWLAGRRGPWAVLLAVAGQACHSSQVMLAGHIS